MPQSMDWWLLLVIVLVLALGWYLSFIARRLDRLHHRVEAASAALTEELSRRAEAAVRLAERLPRGRQAKLTGNAQRALTVERPDSSARAGRPGQAIGVNGSNPLNGADREQAQSALTRSLRELLADPDAVAGLRADPVSAQALDRTMHAVGKAQLARRFHNDAVAQAQRVRRKRVVRWARLSGHAPMPQMVELDDGDDLTPP